MNARLLLGLLLLLLAAVLLPPPAARLFGWDSDHAMRAAPGRQVPIGNGLQLDVIDVGQGPPVVLVHGLPGCAADWAELPRTLAALGHRVIAYDRLGYGYSSRVEPLAGRYTFDSSARDLLGLLDALGIGRATWVGWSYGGGVVQELAVQAPERVSHLVLLGAVGPAQPREDDSLLGFVLASPAAFGILRWVSSVPPLSRWMMQESLTRAFASEEAIPAGWVEQTRAMLALPGALRTFVAEEQNLEVSSLRPEAIQTPTLILHGSADLLVPPAVGEDLHRRLPRSELVIVPDGSHMLHVTHAELVARKIHAFVSGS